MFRFAASLLIFPCIGSAHAQMLMGRTPQSFTQEIEAHATSGTSAEPNSTPVAMLMSMHGAWMLMVHGNGFIADTQQTSPRGSDKLFSTNWGMLMAQRHWGQGQLTLRTMLSLEPATVTGRQYPLLFQQGETAYGTPIADDLDGVVISAPIIEARSFPGSGQIAGNFTENTAEALAAELNSGPLPVDLELVSSSR